MYKHFHIANTILWLSSAMPLCPIRDSFGNEPASGKEVTVKGNEVLNLKVEVKIKFRSKTSLGALMYLGIANIL